MELKVLWGFEGDPEKIKSEGAVNGRVIAGSTITVEDEELAHTLIGKGLVEEFTATKQAKPKENK